MKRLILPIILALLLCGCHNESGKPETTESIPAATVQHLYDPQSTIEEHTQGAVTAYSLAGHSVTGACFFGDQMLILTADDHAQLTTVLVLQGDQPAIVRQVTLDCALTQSELTFSADGSTMAYYNPAENALVLLDKTLSETSRIRLPDQVTERPVLSSDLKTLYYCDGMDIYALDLETGLPRLLKQHNCTEQSLQAIHFNGSLLEVFVMNENGNSRLDFVNTENGSTVGSDDELLTITSAGEQMLLQRMDGIVLETLVGNNGSSLSAVECGQGMVYQAFSMNAVVGVTGSQLMLCNLESGRIQSQTDLGSGVHVLQGFADPAGKYLWFLAEDQQEQLPVLLRWDPSLTPSNDETVHIHRRYTADDPNTEGLAQCQALADSIGQETGLTLVIDGSIPLPQGYEITKEHQVSVFEQSLAKLDEVFKELPEGFLKGLGTVNQSGTVRIALVRQLRDITGEPWTDQGGLHFVDSGNHYIILQVDSDLRNGLLHQLCHVLDAYVYAHSPDYDLWDKLNPKGFVYTGSYDVQADPDDPFLQGDTQRFVSPYSITFAREDRATIFTAAMEPGNEALFALSGIQSKLRYMCSAIREAYEWEDAEITLPWEQYLEQ